MRALKEKWQWSALAIVVALNAPSAVHPSAATSRPGEDVQLAQFVSRLTQNNPELLSADAEWRARLEMVPQSRAFPDPELSYELYLRSPESRVGPHEQSIAVSQRVPWFGKRDLDSWRSEKLAAESEWQVEDLRLDLVGHLKRMYYEAAYLTEALEINREEIALLSRFESIALTRYRTGEGIQQNVIKVQTDLSRLADREAALEEQLRTAMHHMGLLTGSPTPMMELRPIRLGLIDLPADLRQLEEVAVVEHPRVRAAAERVEAAGTWSKRKALETRPDFQFGVKYIDVDRRDDPAGILNPPPDNGKDIVALQVGLNLPLRRRRIRAGVEEGNHRQRVSRFRLRHAQDSVRHDLHESALRIEAAGERARLYDEVILPQARASLDSAQAAYTNNQQEFIDLMDSERILFEARRSHQRLLADYWIALSDFERALGRPFPYEDPDADLGAAQPSGRKP